jgi:hypothetical protein
MVSELIVTNIVVSGKGIYLMFTIAGGKKTKMLTKPSKVVMI